MSMTLCADIVIGFEVSLDDLVDGDQINHPALFGLGPKQCADASDLESLIEDSDLVHEVDSKYLIGVRKRLDLMNSASPVHSFEFEEVYRTIIGLGARLDDLGILDFECQTRFPPSIFVIGTL